MITIVKGEDREVIVRLRIKDDGPLDLTNKVVTITYRNSAGTILSVPCTIVGLATSGRFKFTFNEVQTEALKVGGFDFDTHVVEGTVENIYKTPANLIVVRDRIR